VKADQVHPELSLHEIDDLKHSLEGAKKDQLREVQKCTLKILSGEPKLEGYYRSIHNRNDVKCIDSIIEKIHARRREGDLSFNLDCVEDLIGAQMICPYADDIAHILDWLYSQQGGRHFFEILTTRSAAESERQRRERNTGYRAYHVCLKLKSNTIRDNQLPKESQKCIYELQIKTSLEAAWDAQSHDVTYKPRDTEPDLAEHMKLISQGLAAIDGQTVLLRRRIREEQVVRQELREVAIRLFFYVSLGDQEKSQLGFPKKDVTLWDDNDIKPIEQNLLNLHRGNKIDIPFALGQALVALKNENRYEKERALSAASYLVQMASQRRNKKNLVRALYNRALIRWAFHKAAYAVQDMREVLEMEDNLGNKNTFIYYVCEAYGPKDSDIKRAYQYVEDLKKDCGTADKGQKVGILDTLGRFAITFGKTMEAKKEGLDYISHAAALAKDTPLEPLVMAFQSYHNYLYIRELPKVTKREWI